jgi:hypothetical protein
LAAKFYYTSDDLLQSIKRRILVPENQSTFSEQDFLDIATEEMNIGLVPLVMQMNQDYYLYNVDIPLVNGKTKYAIPYRAIGNKLREVSLVDSNGSLKEMTRIGVGDLPNYNGGASNVFLFYIANNEICLAPDTINSNYPDGQSLRVSIYLRPNALVPNDEVALISGIDRTTGIITVSNFPEAFTVSQQLDFIQHKSPHKILSFDVTATSMDSTNGTITFDVDDIPADLEVNDRICLATQSDIPQLPSDLHVVLAHRTSIKLLEALGDLEALQSATSKLNEMQSNAAALISNRVEDAPRKAVNHHGTLRNGLVRNRFKRW